VKNFEGMPAIIPVNITRAIRIIVVDNASHEQTQVYREIESPINQAESMWWHLTRYTSRVYVHLNRRQNAVLISQFDPITSHALFSRFPDPYFIRYADEPKTHEEKQQFICRVYLDRIERAAYEKS
jgi:hypothetical protein